VEPFPEDLIRFMNTHVESIDQLEILRVLGEDREKEWDSVALAAEVQATPQAVRAHLTAMQGRGLLATMARGAGLACRYGASSPELEQMVGRLLQMYKERPVTMIKMVYGRTKDPLRDFSDAFRLRKED
jgi:predicted ArsR family transcriptional regulator